MQPPGDRYAFPHPIRSVAVIGSGAAGAPAARHLRDAGLHVRVFERQPAPGGIWNWSPEITRPLSVPTPPPSRGAFEPAFIPTGSEETPGGSVAASSEEWATKRQRFSPANPVYWSLTNNVPTSTMTFKDFPYPPNTPENIPHWQLSSYIKSYVAHFNLSALTSYNTRVERVDRIPPINPETQTDSSAAEKHRWRLTLHRLEAAEGKAGEEEFWTEEFDAVVSATGHYNAPFIPGIEGADVWAKQWPDLVLHSNGYRVPEPYKGKDVLIVGIGTSGIDIARDLSPHVGKVYMVGKEAIRGPDGYKGMRQMQRHLLPDNGEALPEIQRFRTPIAGADISTGEIELSDGRVVSNIGLVVFATGYQYSYPYLPQYHHDPSLGTPTDAHKSQLLVTTGEGVLNLYRDVFFIPDPTLVFLGLSVNTSAFNFFEYQSISIARVFTDTARLPTMTSMRSAYNALVATKGEGKFYHFLGKEGERAYVRETVAWLNADAQWSGVKEIEGHTEKWLEASDKIQAMIAARYGLDVATMQRLRAVDSTPAEVGQSGGTKLVQKEVEKKVGVESLLLPVQRVAIVS